MIRVVTQISYKELRMQTCNIFTMISILFTALLCLFSVHVTECTEIQDEAIHIYNYDNNFGDIFHQGALDDFNMMQYTEIDTGYVGPHVGGVFQTEGRSFSSTNFFRGYIVDITAYVYCGDTTLNDNQIYIYYVDKEYDMRYFCNNGNGWSNQTWIPETRYSHPEKFRVEIRAWFPIAVNRPIGFDQITIRTTDVPPTTTTYKSPRQISATSVPAIAPSITNSSNLQ